MFASHKYPVLYMCVYCPFGLLLISTRVPSKAKQRLLHGVRDGIREFTLTMTSTRLPPPGEFNFSKPDEWPKWRRRFEQYRGVSGLNAESETRQVDTLLYCLGDEADSVLVSTNISGDDKKKYEKVIEKFDSYFRVRARYNRRSQKEGESSEHYITELYNLIEFYEYGNLKEEMLRDRLVVGIRDTCLSEKLQTDPDLTLERAKTIRQKEAIVVSYKKTPRKNLRCVASVGDSREDHLQDEAASVVYAANLNIREQSVARQLALFVTPATKKVTSVQSATPRRE